MVTVTILAVFAAVAEILAAIFGHFVRRTARLFSQHAAAGATSASDAAVAELPVPSIREVNHDVRIILRVFLGADAVDWCASRQCSTSTSDQENAATAVTPEAASLCEERSGELATQQSSFHATTLEISGAEREPEHEASQETPFMCDEACSQSSLSSFSAAASETSDFDDSEQEPHQAPEDAASVCDDVSTSPTQPPICTPASDFLDVEREHEPEAEATQEVAAAQEDTPPEQASSCAAAPEVSGVEHDERKPEPEAPEAAASNAASLPVLLSVSEMEDCEVLSVLGIGARSNVDKVVVHRAGERIICARKTLLTGSGAAHVEAELAALQALAGCPHTVQFMGRLDRPGQVEVFMKLVGSESSQTLHDILAQQTRVAGEPLLPMPRMLTLASALLSAAVYMHAKGRIHRNITPRNIIFEGDEVVLCGMGSTAEVGMDGLVCGLVGTAGYMAPEVRAQDTARGAEAGDAYNTKADLFSIGVVLAECAEWHGNKAGALEFLAALDGLLAKMEEEEREEIKDATKQPAEGQTEAAEVPAEGQAGAEAQEQTEAGGEAAEEQGDAKKHPAEEQKDSNKDRVAEYEAAAARLLPQHVPVELRTLIVRLAAPVLSVRCTAEEALESRLIKTA